MVNRCGLPNWAEEVSQRLLRIGNIQKNLEKPNQSEKKRGNRKRALVQEQKVLERIRDRLNI